MRRAAASAFALLAGTGAAMADVTPAEVWADWQAYLTDFGFDVTATETEVSNGLQLTDIVMTQTLPEGAGTTTISFSELTMRGNGDGTVAVVYPAEMPIKVSATGPENFDLDLLYRSNDISTTVSGDPSEMTYETRAASIGIDVTELTAEDTRIDLGETGLEMQDLTSRTVMSIEGGRSAAQVVTAGLTSYDFAMTDPEGQPFEVSGEIERIEMTGDFAIPEGADMNDMTAALAQGFKVNGDYRFGPGRGTFRGGAEGAVTTGETTSEGGTLNLRMDETGIAYGGTSDGSTASITIPQLPVPMSMAIDQSSFEAAVPLIQSGEPQPMALSFLLGGVTLGDNVWAMFDPQGILPRDPATVELDLDGMATVLADLMDPAAMLDADDEAPFTLNALTLNRLLVSLAGAELTGEGDVTFEGAPTEAFDMPAPVGSASFVLTGANALLDKLVEAGLLGQENAMVARMTLGGVAVAGEGEDTLKSDIEFTEGGGIVVNGMRMK
ncbi:hypothetical protein [Roseovarius aquimarinus]|uniref:hypothetical protein n=1 Tax=Roseovarius aquimarinus TaxID=1229156 RepID=UPI003670201B